MLFLRWLRVILFGLPPIGDIPLILYPYMIEGSLNRDFGKIEKALMALGFSEEIGPYLIDRINEGYIPKLRIVFEELPK